jgi:hypothetical protein
MVYFSYQKSKLLYIVEGLEIKLGKMVYFMAIWYILRSFGTCHCLFVLFLKFVFISHLGKLYQEKSGNPGRQMPWM